MVRTHFEYMSYWDKNGRCEPRVHEITIEHVDSQEYLARAIRDTQTFYEIDLLEYIAACGPRGGLYMDVGANVGNHTVYFAKVVAEFVLAVEPSAVARKVLQTNLALNRVSNSEIVPCAVGRRRGAGYVRYPESGLHNLGATRVVRLGGSRASDEPVAVCTLDEIGAQASAKYDLPVRFVKLDIEGSEMDALRGARRLLTEDKPDLCLEAARWRDLLEIVVFLMSFGYAPIRCFCGTPTYYFTRDGTWRSARGLSYVLWRGISSWTPLPLRKMFRQAVGERAYSGLRKLLTGRESVPVET